MASSKNHASAQDPSSASHPAPSSDGVPFSSLGLSPHVLEAVARLGFENATPIQAATIPPIMAGRDVIGQSETGSGKTAAFCIPAVERIDPARGKTQVLILVPTRELATQVAGEVRKLTGNASRIRSFAVYGGAAYEPQFAELRRGVHILVGTPGRLVDHIARGTLDLSTVGMLVLDEADRMLDMGFRDDIEHILKSTPEERQTVFFSATVSKPIRDLIERHSRQPKSVKIEQKTLTVPAIEQWYFEVPQRNKREALLRLIDFHGFKLGIVFCNTQRMVDELADDLVAQGVSADRLHGGMTQAQRTRVMNKFKQAEFEFLIATDVAARGIDVDELELVVNYDLPYDAEDYVHRIGRTGRAGRKGLAATFVTGRDIYKIQFIERFTRTKIQRGKLPTANEVEERRLEGAFDRVREVLERGNFSSAPVDRLLEEGYNSTDIAAALFEILNGATPEPAQAEPSEAKTKTIAAKESAPALRPPSRGMRWVRLDVGREARISPRDIIALLEESLGLPVRSVGIIEIMPGQSFAQIPQQFLDVLQDGQREIETNAGKVAISLHDTERPAKRKKK
jgi:ATP-dependent RNA helicase DeaD